jgi:hypothetical protein
MTEDGASRLVVTLDLDGVADKADFMERCVRALELPDWFGRNWDALEDCLSELPGNGYVLLFDQAQPGDDLGVLIDVLRSSASYWAGRGKPFFAVFVDPARALPLPDLLKER